MITDKQKVARAASMMALSNMGQLGLNIQVEPCLKDPSGWCESASHDVCQIAGNILETEEHEQIFSQEAEWWERMINKDGLAAFINKHPHHLWLTEILNQA